MLDLLFNFTQVLDLTSIYMYVELNWSIVCEISF